MKIAFIGMGNVDTPLADRLQKLGHSVSIGWSSRMGSKICLGDVAEII